MGTEHICFLEKIVGVPSIPCQSSSVALLCVHYAGEETTARLEGLDVLPYPLGKERDDLVNCVGCVWCLQRTRCQSLLVAIVPCLVRL